MSYRSERYERMNRRKRKEELPVVLFLLMGIFLVVGMALGIISNHEMKKEEARKEAAKDQGSWDEYAYWKTKGITITR